MKNHTGTHKESTDLMRKRRASLGKRRTETQMRYDFYSPPTLVPWESCHAARPPSFFLSFAFFRTG